MTNCLQRISSKPITFEDSFPPRKQALLSEIQVNYVEDIIVTRDMENLGMSSREVIQMISDIEQESSYVQAENHMDYLIRENWLPNLKRHGRVIEAQAMTTERSHICVAQRYPWHMMIEAQWEDMRQTKSTRDIFTHFDHYFQLNLDETCFFCNEGDLKVLGSKDKPCHEKIAVIQGFQ